MHGAAGMRSVALVALSLLLAACGGRELGWLVPRASVGVVVRASDTGLAADGYLLIGAPLSGPERMPHDAEVDPARVVHLLGPGPRCELAPLCRWEVRARARAFAQLAEQEPP